MKIEFSQAKDGLIMKIPDTLIPGGLEILFNTDPKLNQSLCKIISANDKTIASNSVIDEEPTHWFIDINNFTPNLLKTNR